jgi:16S rRNA (guanine(966)-N(2))-methyltransferase RsmD
MRVTTGIAKGRRLQSVPSDGTRPITDRVKQALFNIIADDVRESTWLDLFAGTGAVGIEALSRGAKYVTFNDLNAAAIKTIQQNLKTLGFEKNARVLRLDAFALLAGRPTTQYDFIYIAPPQQQGMWSRALLALDQNVGWLAENGCAVVQIDPREHIELALTRLKLTDQRRYGRTMLCFYDV